MLINIQNWHRLPAAAGRTIVLALAVTIAVPMVEPLPAFAATPSQPGVSAGATVGAATDFSARRRHGRRHLGRRGYGPGLAMMGIMIGAIGAIAAAERRREYYESVTPIYAVPPYADGAPVVYQNYAPDYVYAPQPVYQPAPVYSYQSAPVYARPYHTGAAFHGVPQLNVAGAIPRVQAWTARHRHH